MAISENTVALVRCGDYDETGVFEAVEKGLALLGGIGRFVQAGERILLKPNLLAGNRPERAVTTHPSILRAAILHFKAAGAQVSYGDSPGFGRPEGVAHRAGLGEAADALGIPFADFSTGRAVSFPEGGLIKLFTIAAGVLDSDGVISLPKMKTHALTRFTGAVKNQFGCIPGILKGEFHARLNEMERFSQMLVDVTQLVRPRLYIMDAIVAMEGNGPRSGTPRPMKALLFSTDPVALDGVACRMMNLDPELVPTNVLGEKSGLGTWHDPVLAGDPLDSFVAADFVVNRVRGSTTGSMNGFLARIVRNVLVPKPVIDASKCTRCGTCVKVCPATPKALSQDEKRAVAPIYDYSRCIRCYCCQELCPESAIHVKAPPLRRLIPR